MIEDALPAVAIDARIVEAALFRPALREMAADGQAVSNPLNVTDYLPLLRAAFDNLVRWVCDGVEPPPSALPRLADKTAVTRGI